MRHAPTQRLWRRAALLLICPVVIAMHTGALVVAQTAHCDTELNPATTNPLSYRLRGDRCEGVYVQNVGATVLRLVSFTQSYESFDTTVNRPLVLEWKAPDEPVHIRAQSLKSRLYYRMDSERPPRSASFEWPLDIVTTLELTKNDLGLLAWSQRRVGSTNRPVYVPLRVRQRAAPAPGAYRLVLVPGVQIEELFVSVAPVGSDGEPGPYAVDKQPVGLGYYPAGRAVVIPVPAPSADGVYRIDLGATLTQGGASALTTYFTRS